MPELPRIPLLAGLAGLLAASPLIAQDAGSGSAVSSGSGTSRGGASFVDEAHARTDATCTRCGQRTFGTSIEWAPSPPEAARRAQAEGKLVFVLHVSGHFENPGYT